MGFTVAGTIPDSHRIPCYVTDEIYYITKIATKVEKIKKISCNKPGNYSMNYRETPRKPTTQERQPNRIRSC